jgi:hypothetical protein
LIMVSGRGEINGDQLRIIVNEVYPMEKVREKFTKSIVLDINVNAIEEKMIATLRQVLEQHKGSCPCYFRVQGGAGARVYQSLRYTVEPTDAFQQAVQSMFGEQSIRFVSEFSARQ